MSTEPFIGEIKLFGFGFAPRGYMLCSGQILSISQNTALFSLLGTVYGGNGSTTFALPNLNGRIPVGQGQSPGTSNYTLGEVSGTEQITLLSAQMPMHIHTVNSVRVNILANSANGTEQSPDGNYPAVSTGGISIYKDSSTPNTFMGATTVTGTTDIAGGSQPFPILQPYVALNYSIATMGIFPSRN